MTQLIGSDGDTDLLLGRLEEQSQQMRGQMDRLNGQIALIESALQRLKKDEENMKYDVSKGF